MHKMTEKEKKKIIFLDSHKVFLAVKFLLSEENDCFTDYGRGLVSGLLDESGEHKMPVVHSDEYEKLLKNYNDSMKLNKKLVSDNLEFKDNNSILFKQLDELESEKQKFNEELECRIASYHEALDRIAKREATIDKLRAKKKSWWRFWE